MLVDDYRRMISNNVLELYKKRLASTSLQDDDKENIISELKTRDKKESVIEDPETDPLSWGWLSARMAEIYVYCPQGQNELLSLSELETKWKAESADGRIGIAKNFCLMDSLCFPNNTEVRSYELIIVKFRRSQKLDTICYITLVDGYAKSKTVDMILDQRFTKYEHLFKERDKRRVRFNRSGLSRRNSRLILQTENLIIVLTSADEGRVYNFWTRIVHIENEEPANYPGFYKQIRINLRDMSSSMTATLILFDLQINMIDLFKMGDFLGIHMPYIEERSPGNIVLMYTDCTTLFCLPLSELIKDPNIKMFKNDQKGKLNFQDKSYLIDYKFHVERFYINNIPLQGINVTLFGRIDSISENCQQEYNECSIDMYVINLSDKTGSTNVTLWGSIGRITSKYYVGQYIVLEGLRTFKDMNGLTEVVGDASYGTLIYNVSLATGWLATNTLRRHLHVPLKNIIKLSNSALYVDHFITHVLVAGWNIENDSKRIIWHLQDDTGEILAEAVGSVSEDILRSNGHYHQMLTEPLIRSILGNSKSTNLKGKWLWCCLSFLKSGKYQINAIKTESVLQKLGHVSLLFNESRNTIYTMQQLIKEHFQALGCFDFGAATKSFNKALKLNFQLGSVLQTLTKCEQSYTSLDYLKTKLFRKEDYLYTSYTEALNLVKNLHKSSASTYNNGNNGEQLDVDDLCKTLQDFIEIRQSQIVIHRSIPTHFSNINDEKIVDDIEPVRSKAEEHRLNEKLGPLGIGVESELKILKYLFMARKAIVTYNFKDSAIFLYTAKSSLSSWREVCSKQVYPEKKLSNRNEEPTSAFSAISNFFSSEKQSKQVKRGNDSPNNIQWLEKFLSNLTSRMTLYFMHVLLERETILGGDIKSLWRKVDIDYHGMIRNYQNKSGAVSILLLYEISNDIPFYPQGYVGSGVQYNKPTGINSFPCIYCSPKEKPENHLPNIISIIQDKDPKRETPFSRTVPHYFHDTMFGNSYYLIRIDEFVILVIVFEKQPKQSDNNALEFIMDLANKLSEN
ncbi:KICSTOR complex protein C12orf66-like [Rhizophagus clarus]|uniref:KICSTOR complex protein C12orf66-like n=1 Tax=Rhizophagus clarus TaxID=94130 RepID=A0A8H3LQW7_9GLOM|nr:KICSTOR complex protein C12orf66-like [Rhizophagus clarus]